MDNLKKKFSWRAFVSFGMLYSFIIISVTGIVLYLAPPGRVSYWVNWKLLGFTKPQWQAIHTVFSYTFLILGIFHLFTINWKVFLSYLKSKTQKGLNKKREFYFSLVFTVLFFLGIIYSIPPFSSIMDFGEYLTESWENSETEPPIPHAELLTLVQLSESLDSISIEMISDRLSIAQISFNNSNETLKEIAQANNMTPNKVYNIITKKASTSMSGSGIGRKTLEQFAIENDKDIDQIIKILNDNNIKATKEMRIKDIAVENNRIPRDIYNMIK